MMLRLGLVLWSRLVCLSLGISRLESTKKKEKKERPQRLRSSICTSNLGSGLLKHNGSKSRHEVEVRQ